MAPYLLKLPILLVLLFVVNPFPFVEPSTLQSSVFLRTLRNLRGVHRGQKVQGVGQLRSYLQRFGYLRNGDSSSDNFDEAVESALKHYQDFHHIGATGEVDEETIKTMSLPRCGMPDIINNPNPNPYSNGVAHENYTFFPGAPRWRKFALNYGRRSSAAVSITTSVVRQATQNAFQKWAAVSRFTFRETGLPAEIVYGFHRGDHGDGAPFDGPGQVLAHAFAPEDGRCHYDADEQWTSNGVSGIDFETVALHEFGHILGLGHSSDRNAIMFPTIRGTQRNLGQDDINGIRALYG